MTLNYTKYWAVLVLALAIVLSLARYQQFAGAAITSSIPTQAPYTFTPYTFFSATTTGINAVQYATSTNRTDGGGYFVIAGAKKLTFFFSHGGVATTSTATSTFRVQVTMDASDTNGWVDYPRLLTGTSSTLVNRVDIAGATSTIWATLNGFDTESFYAVRVIAGGGGTVGTQGEHTAKAIAEF